MLDFYTWHSLTSLKTDAMEPRISLMSASLLLLVFSLYLPHTLRDDVIKRAVYLPNW